MSKIDQAQELFVQALRSMRPEEQYEAVRRMLLNAMDVAEQGRAEAAIVDAFDALEKRGVDPEEP